MYQFFFRKPKFYHNHPPIALVRTSSHRLVFASSHCRRIIAPFRIALHCILLPRIAPRCIPPCRISLRIPLRWIASNFVCFGLLLAALFPFHQFVIASTSFHAMPPTSLDREPFRHEIKQQVAAGKTQTQTRDA